jgi:hypothetical protein
MSDSLRAARKMSWQKTIIESKFAECAAIMNHLLEGNDRDNVVHHDLAESQKKCRIGNY